MIDPHVHLRDWNQKDKETVIHGMRVAASLGFTHLFDMPNTDPQCTSRDIILERLALGGEASEETGVSYHLYGGLTNNDEQIIEMVDTHSELFPLVIGLKMFLSHSTGNMGITDIEMQKHVMGVLASRHYKGVLALHAEKESLMKPDMYIPGHFETHSDARPGISEIESVHDIINIAGDCGFEGTLHIAHVSTLGTIEEVKKARACGMHITMGATPHHSLLTSSDARVHERYLKMNPPLRTEEDRSALFSALLDGTIDWVESDHAPHTLPDKEKGASGIPALPAMLLLMYQLKKHGADEMRLKSLFGNRAIEVFGLDKEDTIIPSNPLELYMKTKDEYVISPFPERLSD